MVPAPRVCLASWLPGWQAAGGGERLSGRVVAARRGCGGSRSGTAWGRQWCGGTDFGASSCPRDAPWPYPCHIQQLDPENTGFIGVETFASLVHSHELPLDPAKLDMLVALAQGNDEGQVCYQELVDLVSAGARRARGRGRERGWVPPRVPPGPGPPVGLGWAPGASRCEPGPGAPQLPAVATGSLRRSAASVRAASSEPSPTGSEPCPGMGCSMRPAWASTSVSSATWPTRSCPARWIGAGTSTSTARVPRPSSWQPSPSPRWGLGGWDEPGILVSLGGSHWGWRGRVTLVVVSPCLWEAPTWGRRDGRQQLRCPQCPAPGWRDLGRGGR